MSVARSSGVGGAEVCYAYSFPPLGPVAQELVIKGGFEAVIREQLVR